jgi:hypothetical protein
MEVDEESKWLLHHSDWLCRILQLIISIVYLIACWYTSVDLVFRADSLNSPIIGAWVVAILMDILASLNTVQLDKGRGSCCTRLKNILRSQEVHGHGGLVPSAARRGPHQCKNHN